MQFRHLLTLLNETKLSPEQFGSLLDVSGMTLRRWRQQDPEAEVPQLYQQAIADLVPKLVHEGLVSADSPGVRAIMGQAGLGSFQKIIHNMGISPNLVSEMASEERMTQDQTGSIIDGLSQIGINENRRKQVDESEKKISRFKKIGPEWASRIATIWKVIRSKEVYGTEKLVAYGALFYLINPFDLIPDFLYGFGLIDDFAILGCAAAYYVRRFGKLSK